jgi:hypothetical protein
VPAKVDQSANVLSRTIALQATADNYMKNIVLLVLLAVTVPAFSADITEWATAVAKQESTGRAIVFRFAKSFQPGFQRASFPYRVILAWNYKSKSGMPVPEDRIAMDRLEDALASHPEIAKSSLLALVSTGENLREWTYYAASEDGFLSALNVALASEPPFPIKVHVSPDAGWSMYDEFRQGVRE